MVVADEVEQVYFPAKHRGSGVAGTLLAEAERLVAAARHSQAWLAVAPGNTRARRFYERCGWVDEAGVTYTASVPGGSPVEVPCRRYVKPFPTGRRSAGVRPRTRRPVPVQDGVAPSGPNNWRNSDSPSQPGQCLRCRSMNCVTQSSASSRPATS